MEINAYTIHVYSKSDDWMTLRVIAQDRHEAERAALAYSEYYSSRAEIEEEFEPWPKEIERYARGLIWDVKRQAYINPDPPVYRWGELTSDQDDYTYRNKEVYMLTKQQIAEMMVNRPERVGCSFFRIGGRVVLTFPPKSFLMPVEVPVVSDPNRENFRFDQVAEEIAEKAITHSRRGNWQQRVAEAFGLDPNQIEYEGYKVVAVENGKYLSLFDGTTEYKVGERVVQTAKRGHKGGLYVFENFSDCMEGDVALPSNAALKYCPQRAILYVAFGGKIVKYKNKIAASWVRPLRVIETFPFYA